MQTQEIIRQVLSLHEERRPRQERRRRRPHVNRRPYREILPMLFDRKLVNRFRYLDCLRESYLAAMKANQAREPRPGLLDIIYKMYEQSSLDAKRTAKRRPISPSLLKCMRRADQLVDEWKWSKVGEESLMEWGKENPY